jgi:hypothetical protein
MEELSKQDDHKMAAVQATRFILEDQADATAQRGASLATPGLVIHIETTPQPPQIELTSAADLRSEKDE